MIKLDSVNRGCNEIEELREVIKKKVLENSLNIKSEDFVSITALDLKLTFKLYDEYFFKSFFKSSNIKLEFTISKRMTKAAGKTICRFNKKGIEDIEIRMSYDFFKQYDSVERDKKVCGIITKSPLEALLIVFEHELIHVVEFMQYKESNCRGERFKSLAKMTFGHSESYHQLPTNREIAKEKYDLDIGKEVAFVYNNTPHKGILYKINKRATVMVYDKKGQYSDKKGNRYSKWYVPLEILKK